MTPKEGGPRLALASLHMHTCTHRHTQRNMNTHAKKKIDMLPNPNNWFPEIWKYVS